MPIYAHDLDTPLIRALIEEHDENDERIAAAHRRQREIAEQVDTARLDARPTMPTESHRIGITEALRRVDAGEKSDTHHGNPCVPDYRVVCDPTRRWMHIRHGGPTEARSGRSLWSFSDAEIDVLLALIADGGHEVDNWWRSDGGFSVVLKAKP